VLVASDLGVLFGGPRGQLFDGGVQGGADAGEEVLGAGRRLGRPAALEALEGERAPGDGGDRGVEVGVADVAVGQGADDQ